MPVQLPEGILFLLADHPAGRQDFSLRIHNPHVGHALLRQDEEGQVRRHSRRLRLLLHRKGKHPSRFLRLPAEQALQGLPQRSGEACRVLGDHQDPRQQGPQHQQHRHQNRQRFPVPTLFLFLFPDHRAPRQAGIPPRLRFRSLPVRAGRPAVDAGIPSLPLSGAVGAALLISPVLAFLLQPGAAGFADASPRSRAHAHAARRVSDPLLRSVSGMLVQRVHHAGGLRRHAAGRPRRTLGLPLPVPVRHLPGGFAGAQDGPARRLLLPVFLRFLPVLVRSPSAAGRRAFLRPGFLHFKFRIVLPVQGLISFIRKLLIPLLHAICHLPLYTQIHRLTSPGIVTNRASAGGMRVRAAARYPRGAG